jgi:hypothetical protein
MIQIEQFDESSLNSLPNIELAVLVFGRSNCQNCSNWHAELRQAAASGDIPTCRVFLVNLDSGAAEDLAEMYRWVNNIDVLPMNIILVQGEVKKEWAGGSIQQLSHRLSRYL